MAEKEKAENRKKLMDLEDDIQLNKPKTVLDGYNHWMSRGRDCADPYTICVDVLWSVDNCISSTWCDQSCGPSFLQVLILEEKLADKEAEIQRLRNQLQQKSKSSTVEEIVETHAAHKKDIDDFDEDVIVTMEDGNEYS